MKVFSAADILLPGQETDLARWAALACDQFTSQPEYWQNAEALAAGAPSTLHITLPEAYLESPDKAARIAAIHQTMRAYRAQVLTRALHGFVYVERTTGSGVRQGLVGAVDLEAYSYAPDSAPLVRPSERTVADRIPPRLAVRRGAALEAPHIMMLADDAACAIVEPFAAKKASLEPLYDTELMLGGGRVAGWAVANAADIDAVERAVSALGEQGAFDEKYPEAAGRPPLAIAVGDGNHSLATAKAYWEELKAGLAPGQRQNHPARWCLAELVNVHSPALEIEPIHRAVFGIPAREWRDAFLAFCAAHGAARCEPGRDAKAARGAVQRFCLIGAGQAEEAISLRNAPWPLAVGTLEAFLAQLAESHPQIRVDYIHGEGAVRALAKSGAVGVLLPDFAKGDLFRGVALGGVLPKKTFSMGHAEEKRYYLECRAIETK